MQAAVDEVRRQIHHQRPFHRVGTYQCHVIAAQQLDKWRRAEALVTDLYCVTQWLRKVDLQIRPARDPPIVASGEGESLAGISRQQPQEGGEALAVEAELRGKLPQHGAKLASEREHA